MERTYWRSLEPRGRKQTLGNWWVVIRTWCIRSPADMTLAQEVTPFVFIRLAKTPPKLDSEAQLLAWLHRTTVHVSIDLWRSESRRRAREQQAVVMQTKLPFMAPNLKTKLDARIAGLRSSHPDMIPVRT